MDATQERWLPVPGYEGSYEVSDQGAVRSIARVVGGPRGPRWWAARYLVAKAGANGYRSVSLRSGGVTTRRTVHSLVMEAFIGPHPGKGFQICHGNGDPLDNCVSNLRYDTEKENHRDMVRHGRSLRGTRHPGHLLTPDDVRDIRSSLAAGTSTVTALAQRHGVSRGTIYAIIKRRTWSWLD